MMESALVPILTALIGAIAGLVGGGFSGRQQARLEHERWSRGVSDAFNAELRACVKDLTTKVAEAVHSMCWLCWLARNGAERLTQARIDQYDQELHKLLPQILGLHAVIAGMDHRVYLELDSLIKRVFDMDAQIGYASLSFATGAPESAQNLLIENSARLPETARDLALRLWYSGSKENCASPPAPSPDGGSLPSGEGEPTTRLVLLSIRSP